MNARVILWIYIVLLVIGGVIGLLKGKSKVSLIMSVVFAVLLSFTAVPGLLPPEWPDWVADVLLGLLLIVFAIRLGKTKKFMPAGLMLLITVLAMALRHV